MPNQKLVTGTLAYAGVTFPLAYFWHLVIFEEMYRHLRFTTIAEPNVALGFFTILFQGILLSAVYPYFRQSRKPFRNGIVFGLVVAAFIWSAATVAHVAKHDVVNSAAFIAFEALYFLVNFVVYGLLLGFVYRTAPREAETARAGAVIGDHCRRISL